MKRLSIACCLVALLLAGPAIAQDDNEMTEPGGAEVKLEVKDVSDHSPPELAPSQVSPEIYLYLQELRRHNDPKQAVRRRAEIRAAARTSRIAAMKWYGMSNSRPQVNPIPFMGTYSPTWVGNGYDRYDWLDAGWPSVTLRVEQEYEVRR